MRVFALLSKEILRCSSIKSYHLARNFSDSISNPPIPETVSIQLENLLKTQFIQSSHHNPQSVPNSSQTPLTLLQIQFLLEQYFNIKQIPENFFESIEHNILENLKNFSEDNLKVFYTILTLYLKIERKNLSFLEVAQKKIFQYLGQLNFEQIKNLYILCSEQRSMNVQDMINYVQKPFLNEIFLRFDKTDLFSVSEALFQYAERREVYGIYVSDEIKGKVFECIYGLKKNLKGHPQKILQINYNLLYFSYISGILNADLATQISNNILFYHFKYSFSDLIKFAFLLCPFSTISLQFWLIFLKNAHQISKCDSLYLKYLFFQIMIHLKSSEPRMQTQIFKSLRFEDQDMILNFKGYANIKTKPEKNEAKDLICQVLSDKKLEFVLDLDDGICIDIAVPNKRLAYIVCEPSEYIWPECTPNGLFSEKCFILTKKHWKVRIIHSQPNPPKESLIIKLINEDLLI